MEEANHRSHSYSKKRKQPCALENPSRGIFTRSRSQIYLHCNRSGRLRSDPPRYGTDNSDLFCLLTLNKRPRRPSCSSIKDFRTSRVFSPGELNDGGKVLEEETEGFGDGVSRKDLQPTTPDSACFEKDGSIGKVLDDLKAIGDVGEVEREQQENMEDRETATPPDAEILLNKVEYEPHNMGHVHKSNSQNDVHIEGCSGDADDRQNGSNLPGKSVLTPCYRGKLFKTPGSLSYRRLLPYLMDISKDKSCVQKIDQLPRIESGPEQKLFQPVSASQSQGIKEKTNTENSPREGSADDLHGNKPKLISPEDITECSIPNDSMNDLSGRDKTSSNSGMEKINAGVPCEFHKFPNSSIDFPISLKSTNLDKCDVNGATSDETKLVENQKARQYDNYFACKTQNLDHMDNNKSSKDGDLGDYFDDPKQFDEARVLKKCAAHHDYGAQNKGHPVSNEQGNDKLTGDGDCYASDQIEGSNKECFQTTPPDDGIFLWSDNHDFEIPLTQNIQRKNGSVHDSRINSCSRRKMMKMFEIRSSFSYRRLLPFLTNIIENESGACRDGIKVQKISEQKSLKTFSTSNSDETTVEGSNDASTHQIPRLSGAVCSVIDHQPELPFPEQVVAFQGEPKLKVEETASIANKKLETVSYNADVAHGCGIPSIKRCSFSTKESMSKDANFVLNQSSLSSEIGSMKCITRYTSAGKRVKFSSISPNFSQIGACVPLGVPSLPFTKGILKRNPRGCRGICTCLDCAAFRLHATKAFEFSRNQMQGAEEVALDLIRELTHLRNALEKSASNTDYSSAAIADQVKEVCRKASEVERLARNRLSQMNCELNIHCRIPCEKRPRVRFANQVEEKSYAKSDSEQQP